MGFSSTSETNKYIDTKHLQLMLGQEEYSMSSHEVNWTLRNLMYKSRVALLEGRVTENMTLGNLLAVMEGPWTQADYLLKETSLCEGPQNVSQEIAAQKMEEKWQKKLDEALKKQKAELLVELGSIIGKNLEEKGFQLDILSE